MPPTVQHPDPIKLDVVYVGDFRLRRDPLRRVVEEVLLNRAIGYRTGLAHLDSGGASDTPVDFGIQELVDTGAALSLDLDDPAEARLAIIVHPSVAFDKRPKLPVRIVADQVLAIVDEPDEAERIASKNARLVQYFGDVVSWTATAYDVLSVLQTARVRAMGTIWQSFGAIRQSPVRRHRVKGSRPLVGVAVDAGQHHWPADANALRTIWNSKRFRVRVIGTPPVTEETAGWEIVAPDQRQHVRFLEGLDAFLYYPAGRPPDLPLTAIGACLSAGIPVFLPPQLKPVLGKGPIYLPGDKVEEALHAEIAATTRPSTSKFNPVEAHRRRMRFFVRAAKRTRRRDGRRALFFSSNGDGLGHITRLLAIARRLPSDVTPIFASLSHGVAQIEDAGFHAEMIVSHRYARLDERAAYPWMAQELSEILLRHAPDVFVFDGGNPYGFLTEVTARQRRTACLWVRRGMWQREQDNRSVIAKEKFFDGVIEPSDLAGSRDQGATAQNRDGVMVTPPIRLIDSTEQLPRDEARTALGLNREDPAVLIQLGVGNRSDLAITFDRVLSSFGSEQRIQLMQLNAPISSNPIRGLDRVRDVSVYPVARYLKAFDFAISAAGYNSFHELIASRIPTIFIVKMTPDLDDQMGRAEFAQREGCGYALGADDLVQLPEMYTRLLNPDLREAMARNCSRLDLPNGATPAAELVAEFAR